MNKIQDWFSFVIGLFSLLPHISSKFIFERKRVFFSPLKNNVELEQREIWDRVFLILVKSRRCRKDLRRKNSFLNILKMRTYRSFEKWILRLEVFQQKMLLKCVMFNHTPILTSLSLNHPLLPLLCILG